MQQSRVTVCGLLYGDYPQLARRLLQSWRDYLPKAAVQEVRLGCNAVSDATRAVVDEYVTCGVLDRVYHGPNIWKYPRMRQMLREPAWPTTPYVMWFDDDSYITSSAGRAWWPNIASVLQDAAMLGGMRVMHWPLAHAQWVQQQPWWNGVPFRYRPERPGPYVQFITGGWWVIRTEILQRFDWPPDRQFHQWGDSTLCEALRQNGLRYVNYDTGVAINADDLGRADKARRRGTGPTICDETAR